VLFFLPISPPSFPQKLQLDIGFFAYQNNFPALRKEIELANRGQQDIICANRHAAIRFNPLRASILNPPTNVTQSQSPSWKLWPCDINYNIIGLYGEEKNENFLPPPQQ